MLRLIGILVSVLFGIATVVLSRPAFFHLEQHLPFTQAVASRGFLALGFGLITVVMVILMAVRPLRGFAMSIAAIALIGALISAGTMLVRGIGGEGLPEKTADSVRVLAWNTAGEAVRAEEIVATILEQEADIVALPETIDEVGENIAIMLREQGHPMWVHHVQFNPEIDNGPQSWQTTLLISPDLGDYSVIDSAADGSNNTASVPSVIAMPVDGHGPTVVAVHTVAPRPTDLGDWRTDLRWVADQCPGGNVILAGDFNATLDHLADLGVDGGDIGACFDAAARTGNGAVGTWPTGIPALLGAPIDHVMATPNWTPVGSEIIEADGSQSDHRAVIVQLEPTQ